jgi:uncharacterized protein
LETDAALAGHPKSGASWEKFAMEQVLAVAETRDAYFRAVHSGGELDLFFIKNGRRLGFEFKCADAPTMTQSMQTVMTDLKLDHLTVVCPGAKSYAIAENATVVPLGEVGTVL